MANQRAMGFDVNGLAVSMLETENGGVLLKLSAKSITDEIVIPKRLRPAFKEALDAAAKTLGVWNELAG